MTKDMQERARLIAVRIDEAYCGGWKIDAAALITQALQQAKQDGLEMAAKACKEGMLLADNLQQKMGVQYCFQAIRELMTEGK